MGTAGGGVRRLEPSPDGSPASWSIACSELFFRAFNWFFDVTINIYGRIGRGTASRQRRSRCSSMAA